VLVVDDDVDVDVELDVVELVLVVVDVEVDGGGELVLLDVVDDDVVVVLDGVGDGLVVGEGALVGTTDDVLDFVVLPGTTWTTVLRVPFEVITDVVVTLGTATGAVVGPEVGEWVWPLPSVRVTPKTFIGSVEFMALRTMAPPAITPSRIATIVTIRRSGPCLVVEPPPGQASTWRSPLASIPIAGELGPP